MAFHKQAPELQTQPSGSIPSASPEQSKKQEVEDDDNDDLPEPGPVPKEHDGIIEMETFQQIRDMDEDDDDEGGDDEFSRGIVWGFFDQAEKTFGEMREAL